jgi:hypothetical protein
MGFFKVALIFSDYLEVSKVLSYFSKEKHLSDDINYETFENIIWSINCLGNYMPGKSCLIKAMTAKLMFAKRNCRVEIWIGISKKRGEEIVGHAWVEKGGEILIGGDTSISRFVPVSYDINLLNKVCAKIK